MAISVRCGSCGGRLRAANKLRGLTRTCPSCHSQVLIEGEQVPDFDVFISYAHADQTVAGRVCAVLESAGLRCWIAPRNIAPGAKRAAAIMDAIDDVRVMVLVFSPHANASEDMLGEVARAVSRKVPIVVFRIGMGEMSADLEYFLSATQWVDAASGPLDEHIQALIPQMRALLKEKELARISIATTESVAIPEISLPPLPLLDTAMTNWTRRRQTEFPSLLAATTVLAAVLVCLVAGLVAYLVVKPSAATAPVEQPPAQFPPIVKATPPPASLSTPKTQASARPQSRPTIRNSIGMELVLVPAGEFLMGSPGSDGRPDEKPQHRVRITQPFYLGVYEVTVGNFRKFVEDTGYRTDGEKRDLELERQGYRVFAQRPWRYALPGRERSYPVTKVSWNDAVRFCNWLSRKEWKKYRLPTEAEWEHACRAGTSTRYSFGDDESDLPRYATFSGKQGGTIEIGGQWKPNPWGLYDMHGNASEWCADWYADDYYRRSPGDDPTGPISGVTHVWRGGAVDDARADTYRSASRCHGDKGDVIGASRMGFRVARNLTP